MEAFPEASRTCYKATRLSPVLLSIPTDFDLLLPSTVHHYTAETTTVALTASDSFSGLFSSSANSPTTSSNHGVLAPNQPVPVSSLFSRGMTSIVHHHAPGQSSIGSASSVFAPPQRSNSPAVGGRRRVAAPPVKVPPVVVAPTVSPVLTLFTKSKSESASIPAQDSG
jgi:hypothetical protein